MPPTSLINRASGNPDGYWPRVDAAAWPADGYHPIHAMFVQTARAALGHGNRLTLLGMSPSTLYLSDRPQRVVGHIHTRQFVDLWEVGDDSFGEEPPNAVLSFIEPADGAEGVPADVVVTLQSPWMDGGRLTYAVRVLDGVLPAEAAGCALFIDPLGWVDASTPAVSAARPAWRRQVRHWLSRAGTAVSVL